MSPEKKMTAAEAIAERQQAQKALGALLSSPQGNQLITELEQEFEPDSLVGRTVEETYFNLGARHVVRTIKTLRDEAQKG